MRFRRLPISRRRAPQRGCHDKGILISHKEQDVAFFSFARFQDALHFFFAEEFGNRALDGTVFVDNNPSKALGTIDTDKVYKAVEFTARDGAVALDVDGFDKTAFFR